MIERHLKETGLDPACLELEVTESSVMKNTESAINTLRELKMMGIKISIDDFGSGYSSLSYLKHLPIDVLKIDQSFVRDMTTDPKDAAIVMAIIQLAHSLQLKVNAEGVETEEQLRFLRLLRCDEMQGYLFCRPLPVEAFEQLLLEGRSLSTMNAPSLSLS
jgi:EAL domain-containing protein (putative c-di-GMP-specific phosphodiesterase class I)